MPPILIPFIFSISLFVSLVIGFFRKGGIMQSTNQARIGSNIALTHKIKCYCCSDWFWVVTENPKKAFLCWKCWSENADKNNHLPLSPGSVTAKYVDEVCPVKKEFNSTSENIQAMFAVPQLEFKPKLEKETILEEKQVDISYEGEQNEA